MMKPALSFGVDELISRNPGWKKSRLALVTNEAATTVSGHSSREQLLKERFNIIRLFSPEHGLHTTGADGALMNDITDTLTGLPVISLYGDKLGPAEEDLKGIDLVLFDMPDIGTRFYTYLWTMTHVLESCARYDVPFIILDRPNPLSGSMALVEGPLLDENRCASFIGRWNIPLRHSSTLGELCTFFNQTRNIWARTEVITVRGWTRDMFQPDWGIPFVPASPAMRSFASALLYPGTGLLEATCISEGRGTAAPFVQVGAPWIDGRKLMEAFAGCCPEVYPEITSFTPEESKYSGECCHGIGWSPKEVPAYRSVQTGMIFIKLVKDLFPESFDWKPYPTHVNPDGGKHLDKLLGIPESEALFEKPLEEFVEKIRVFTNGDTWTDRIRPFLLYS